MKWCIQNFNPLITTIGLIFDLIGAWLVAWEIVQQYKGEKFAPVDIANLNIDSTAEDIVKDEMGHYLSYPWFHSPNHSQRIANCALILPIVLCLLFSCKESANLL